MFLTWAVNRKQSLGDLESGVNLTWGNGDVS